MSRAVPRFRRTNPSLPAVGSTQGVTLYRIWGSIEGQLTITTFYYLGANNAPTQAQLTTLEQNIHNNLFVAYSNCLSLDWTCTKETLDVVHRADIAGLTSVASAGSSGARPTGHEPTEVSITVLRYSAFKGQHGRGRLSLPAVSTADVLLSRWTGAPLTTALGVLATNMLTSASDGINAWAGCIAQRSSTSPKLVVNAATLVRTALPTLLGTVRRRKIGRGK